jgi:hypothetical protein
LSIVLRFQVENDAPFVGVAGSERKTSFRVSDIAFEGPFAPHRIAFRRFNEDDIRAEIGEKPAAIPAFATREV